MRRAKDGAESCPNAWWAGWEGPVAIGSHCADGITLEGDGWLVLGRGGDDRIEVTGSGLFEGASSIFGGGGDDVIQVQGGGNYVSGGTGDDEIQMGFFTAPSFNNRVFGDSGNDVIAISGSGNLLRGGDGNDLLFVDGFRTHGNDLFGEAGDDLLIAWTRQARMDGGDGDDVLEANSPGDSLFYTDDIGAVMTGGSGRDSFSARPGNMVLVDGGHDGLVSEGDRLTGIIDIITDYEAGERLSLEAAAERVETVRLSQAEPTWAGAHPALLEPGQHAVFRGRLDEREGFFVRAGGPDLLLLHGGGPDGFYGLDESIAHGLLVLRSWPGEAPVIG
ncbi:calcium-binding protein [Roseomonas sp. KE0001]|uniref:calcium-binding protein n=1 Tax=Roseomonas sp. KE0001 TaxID=2479201 RepID=UPI0018E03BEC|nr:hypothetical protein [Roseomonas sp. KE0001]MBI0434932.1 calcium-binding protein [Roseomonas sp. KE0001]